MNDRELCLPAVKKGNQGTATVFTRALGNRNEAETFSGYGVAHYLLG